MGGKQDRLPDRVTSELVDEPSMGWLKIDRVRSNPVYSTARLQLQQ
jgi:hypothetical protein